MLCTVICATLRDVHLPWGPQEIIESSKFFGVSVDIVHFAIQASERGGGIVPNLALHGRLRLLMRRVCWLHRWINDSSSSRA